MGQLQASRESSKEYTSNSGLPVAFPQIVTESKTLCARLRLFPGKAGKPFLS